MTIKQPIQFLFSIPTVASERLKFIKTHWQKQNKKTRNFIFQNINAISNTCKCLQSIFYSRHAPADTFSQSEQRKVDQQDWGFFCPLELRWEAAALSGPSACLAGASPSQLTPLSNSALTHTHTHTHNKQRAPKRLQAASCCRNRRIKGKCDSQHSFCNSLLFLFLLIRSFYIYLA